ncbi:hypothetical protein AVEN_63088-1 [Araneus ventricosus]|uniref:Uncharacterized protein n=1 Tax=Araneus ventricosus TaxID=182803 RepID=A0A4Y2D4N3_ARAVE|nr:hypothetical protein AVEN_192205-1 [Araneus ventricosus]GBM11732.1 hypothetical protein AVEN_63088-1 [Araneus ventricosus]
MCRFVFISRKGGKKSSDLKESSSLALRKKTFSSTFVAEERKKKEPNPVLARLERSRMKKRDLKNTPSTFGLIRWGRGMMEGLLARSGGVPRTWHGVCCTPLAYLWVQMEAPTFLTRSKEHCVASAHSYGNGSSVAKMRSFLLRTFIQLDLFRDRKDGISESLTA